MGELTQTELQAITNDYFLLEKGNAWDIYFFDSYFMKYFMDERKGLWERPAGGEKIKVPLQYDIAQGGFYNRNDALNSDDKEMINAAFFNWKHAYGNATIYRADELKASGAYEQVSLVTSRIEAAQKKVRKILASSIYDAAGDDSVYLTGLRATTSESSSTPYGGIAEDDLVAEDGTKPWEGKTITTSEVITLDVIRNMRSQAKVSNGPGGKPDIGFTTEDLFNVLVSILTHVQRYTPADDVAKAGFTGVSLDGMTIVVDDYCPDTYFFALNTNYIGFAIHKEGFFEKDPWRPLDGPAGRTMKIFWDGNLICSNRKAHIAHSNLSTS